MTWAVMIACRPAANGCLKGQEFAGSELGIGAFATGSATWESSHVSP